MRIVYLGATAEHSTSLDRARALERLGHEVRLLDPGGLVPGSRWLARLHHRTGFRLLQRRANRWLDVQLGSERYDLAWVNAGELWGAAAVRRIRAAAGRVVNYNNDDPFGCRDGRYWDMYRQSVARYDLLCVLREVNVAEAKAAGARRLIRVWMSYDPVRQARLAWSGEDARRWGHEVVFVGTWMPERGPLMATLLRLGVPVSIYGSRWQKAREWPVLHQAWRGPELCGEDYVKSIQYARVCLGLLSKGNRDLHTRRSVEIPFIGGLLCAERTSEHLAMFVEGREAVYWDDAAECASQCLWLLGNEPARRQIAEAGHARVRQAGFSNDSVMQSILDEAQAMATPGAGAAAIAHELHAGS
jgi:hypothetical protein